jgi:hypothetical protein
MTEEITQLGGQDTLFAFNNSSAQLDVPTNEEDSNYISLNEKSGNADQNLAKIKAKIVSERRSPSF